MKNVKLELLVTFLGLFYFNAKAQSIDAGQVPETVKLAFQKDFPFAKDVTWEKNKENYEAIYNKDRAALIDSTGKVIANNNRILPQNLPEVILNYFRTNLPYEKLVQAQRIIMTVDGAVFFLAVSKTNIYKFDPLGKLLLTEKL